MNKQEIRNTTEEHWKSIQMEAMQRFDDLGGYVLSW